MRKTGTGSGKSRKSSGKKNMWVAPKLTRAHTGGSNGSLVVGAEGYGCSYTACVLA